MYQQIALPILDSSHTGEARRAVAKAVREWGLCEEDTGRLAIIVTETVRNAAQHGSGGELLVRRLAQGIELLVLDKGPGMRDIAECLRDGYSSAGTPGTGLGAVRRLSDVFDIYSASGQGTALLVQVASTPESHEAFEIGAVNLPMKGEAVCGDAWAAISGPSWISFLVADGIGHGPAAAEAAQEAVRTFRQPGLRSLMDTMELIHLALRKTRGAAVALTTVDMEAAEVRFVGVGNISASIIGPGKQQSLVSHNGLVGHQLHRLKEFVYPWPKGALLLLNSDGLATWHLQPYAGLAAKHASLVAGVLYRDFKRGRDDVTVLAARERRRNAA